MIKRILVPLDPDADTPVATRYATEIARHHDALVTGLAVVDTEGIAEGARGGGIGSLYYAEKLRERLTEETRVTAQKLIHAFDLAMRDSGVQYRNAVEEGVPFRRINEDSKSHDLVVVGRDPHFFYGHPADRGATLVHLVRDAICPVLTVSGTYEPVERVLVAYDGSEASARTLHAFAQLKPFGASVAVSLLNVYDGEKEQPEAELRLQQAQTFLEAHAFPVAATAVNGKPIEHIRAHADQTGAQAIVMGAHAVAKWRQMAFGSTTATLIEDAQRPLFLFH